MPKNKEKETSFVRNGIEAKEKKKLLQDAAWYYPEPLPDMNKIKGYVAFYKGKAEVKSS